MNKLISLALLAVLVFYGFRRCTPRDATGMPIRNSPKGAQEAPATVESPSGTPTLSLNGKPVPDSVALVVSERLQNLDRSGSEDEEPGQEGEASRDGIASSNSGTAPGPGPESHPQEASSGFSCQGKIYCTQMASCEEARFYLSHCPGVKLDGDGDGVPCESQWCG